MSDASFSRVCNFGDCTNSNRSGDGYFCDRHAPRKIVDAQHDVPRIFEPYREAPDAGLDALRQVGEVLLAETERVNAQIKDLEARITEANAGVSAGVDLEPGVKISYTKQQAGWCLVYTDKNGWYPLLSVSRDKRVAVVRDVVRWFPLLVEALVAEARRQVEEMRGLK